MKHKLAFLLFISIINISLAQETDLWQHFTTQNGLADNEVRAICLADNGALWFGTGSGVSKYFESSWTIPEQLADLTSQLVLAVKAGTDGTIWLGTENQGVFRYENEKLTSFTVNDGLVDNSVGTICRTPEGALWFGTTNGASRYFRDHWQTFTTANGLVDNHIRAIFQSSDGSIWFATPQGVSRYLAGNWKTYTIANGLIANSILSIAESPDGALWFGTAGGGVSRYKNNRWMTFTIANGLAGNSVRVIFSASDGALWFGTEENGVSRYLNGLWTNFNSGNGLAGDFIYSIVESGDQGVWFGSRENGVSRYREQVWTNFSVKDGLVSDSITAIHSAQNGAVWLASWRGVSRFQHNRWAQFTTANGLNSDSITALTQSNNGALWFGTWEKGICRFLNSRWTLFSSSEGLASDTIFALCQAKAGGIWCGTQAGVSRYQNGNWSTFTTADGLPSNEIWEIFESSDGSLWCATHGRGICHWQNGIWTTYSTGDGLAANDVYAIAEANDGSMWFGTWGSGVSHFINGVWTTYTVDDGLASNHIPVIRKSRDGALWFGSINKGVTRYRAGQWLIFTQNDGLVHNFINAISEAGDGTVWLGSYSQGVSRLKPDTFAPFTIFLQKPTPIFGNSSPLFVAAGQDFRTADVDIDFSYAITDTSVTGNQIPWQAFSPQASIQTADLANGIYTFRIRAQDRWGNIDPSPAQLTFIVDVTPPTVTMISPTPGQHLRDKFPILGSVFDNSPIQDFQQYQAAYQRYETEINDPDWILIFTGSNTVRNDTLAIWDTSILPDGDYRLRLTGQDSLNHVSEDQLMVTVDNTLPHVKITSPPDGANLTGEVNIRGDLSDNYFAKYRLEFKLSTTLDWQVLDASALADPLENGIIYSWVNHRDSGDVALRLTGWDQAGNFTADSVSFILDNQVTPQVQITSPVSGARERQTVLVKATIFDANPERLQLAFRMSFHEQWQILHEALLEQSIEDQIIFLWENSSDSGLVILKLTVWDEDGNFAADSVVFILDNPEYHLPVAVIHTPQDSSYLAGWIPVVGEAFDEGFDRYVLALKNENIDTVVVENFVAKRNEELFVLDTRAFPDAQYQLSLTVFNDRSYQKSTSATIIIDNTPPVAEITTPLADTISCYVDLQGTAEDQNFKKMALHYASVTENDSANYILIDTTFTTWETSALDGFYSLYLVVEDYAGLKTISQRTYYINNPRFDAQYGLKKTQGEFSLYLPPKAYQPCVICMEKLKLGEFEAPVDAVTPTELIFEIHSSIEDEIFLKPGILTVNYHDVDLTKFDENKLSLHWWDNNQWNLIGGTITPLKKIISATIHRTGIYGLMENKESREVNKNLQLAFHPRVFSPAGNGREAQTSISFELGKPSSVTIKIYNTAGRFVRSLKESDFMPFGSQVVPWDGKDQWGNFCVSGLYLVSIQAGDKIDTRTVMVLNK